MRIGFKSFLFNMLFIFSIQTSYCTDSLYHLTTLLPDTSFICCGESVTIHSMLTFNNYEWSNGSNSDSATVLDPGVIYLYAYNSSDTVYWDSIQVINCVYPELPLYICESNLPYSLHDYGLPDSSSLTINNVLVDSIKPDIFLTNTYLLIEYTFYCNEYCGSCTLFDSLFIISDDTLRFSTDQGIINDDLKVCNNLDSIITLYNSIPGGWFSCNTCPGPPSTNSYNFNPELSSLGNHLITYQVSYEGCNLIDSLNLLVVSPTNPLFLNLSLDYLCTNTPSFVLEGFPGIGEFHANGIELLNNIINPQLFSSYDSLALLFTSIDDNGCIVDTTKFLDLRLPPAIAFNELDQSYCLNDPTVPLVGVPGGGEFTLDGQISLQSNSFNASEHGTGIHTLTYMASDSFCSNQTSTQFIVFPIPVVQIITTDTIICQNGSPVVIDVIPPLPVGNFSPTSFSSGIINPALIGISSTIINYKVTDVNGCSNSAERQFRIVPPPVVLLNDPIYRCIPNTLTLFNFSASSTDIQSIWSIDNNTFQNNSLAFDFNFANPGNYSIYLEVFDENECYSDTTFNASVPAENVSYIELGDSIVLARDSVLISGDSNVPLISYLWLLGDGSITSDSTFYHSYHDAGLYTILLSTIDSFGCSDTALSRILIKDPLDSGFDVIRTFPNPIIDDLTVDFYLPYSLVLRVEIFSIDGKLITSQLFNNGEQYNAGIHTATIELEDIPSGLYVLAFYSENDFLNKPQVFKRGELIYETLYFLDNLKFFKY